jgi:DNA-binding CsgD family transcriptional regulator
MVHHWLRVGLGVSLNVMTNEHLASSARQIAGELNLSVKTVSTYRTRILEKMAMKSNADITYYAIKNGLIQ